MIPGSHFQTSVTEYSFMLIKGDPNEQDAVECILEDLDNVFSKEMERKLCKYCPKSA